MFSEWSLKTGKDSGNFQLRLVRCSYSKYTSVFSFRRSPVEASPDSKESQTLAERMKQKMQPKPKVHVLLILIHLYFVMR